MSRVGALVLTATIGADGTGSALTSVAPGRGFTITRMAARGTLNGAPVTGGGTLRVYLNGELFDSTAAAGTDTSDTSAELVDGDQIRADWTNGRVGAVMSLTVEGAR